jgi:outer membrane protein
MMMRRLFKIGAVVVSTLTPGMAFADSEPSPIAGYWTITVGVGGQMLPAYVGSDHYTFLPFPIFNVRRAGSPWRFSTMRDGFGFAIVDVGRFRFGPVGKIVLPRDQSDYAALRGLGNVDLAVEIGAFAEFWAFPWLRTRAEVRQGFGGHEGIVSDISADAVVPATERLTLSAGPRVTLATADAVRPYFGVNAVQSVNSGLPVYNPGGGVSSYGFGAQAHQQWTPQWATKVFVEYDRLVGDVAKSPVLFRDGSRDQVRVGIGASYSFDISLR